MDPTDTLDADACYRALCAHDARFDGRFFTGVSSTGIYCRPVCRVRTPRRENCRFFAHAAQAEQAGFRPCLRCRPELAPAAQAWSMQDTSASLTGQAMRLLDDPEAWPAEGPGMGAVAKRLGVSDRHLRRLFEQHLGVTPLQYLQTRRLLTAKQLLADTSLPVTRIAQLSGFASLRRFNAAFLEHYGLNPTQLRRSGTAGPADGPGIPLRLAWRPPYDVAALMGFLRTRQLQGVEQVGTDAGQPFYARTVRIASGPVSHQGWLVCRFDEARCQVLLRVSDALGEVLPVVMRRVRAALDLDADPQAIQAVLGGMPEPAASQAGLRVPGSLDGFELAVRAVLGQQVTVAAARTLAQRLVESFGTAIETPLPGLNRLFPDVATLACADGEALGRLGIVRQRQAAISALARAVAEGRLSLQPGADVAATTAALRELPGIGDWTAQYIALRALRWPDAFPAGDVALHKALGLDDRRHAARDAEALAQAWRPWRGYALMRAWHSLGQTATAAKESP